MLRRSSDTRLAERLPERTWVNLQQLARERVLFRFGAEIDLHPQIWHSRQALIPVYETETTQIPLP